jgi:hypothetical protein
LLLHFQILRGDYAINNYLIFKNVFFNTIHQKNLFIHYPDLYFDLNHYGVFFSALIAPFAMMPDWLGISFGILPTLLSSFTESINCRFQMLKSNFWTALPAGVHYSSFKSAV